MGPSSNSCSLICHSLCYLIPNAWALESLKPAARKFAQRLRHPICHVILLKKVVLWEPPREVGWEQIAFDFLKFREGRAEVQQIWSVSLWSLLQGKAVILQVCGAAGACWEAGMWIRCQVSECGEIEELCCGSHRYQTDKPCQIQPPLALDIRVPWI